MFALSVVFANASLYDPYWSVAPPVIALAWALWSGGEGVGLRQVLVLVLVTAWAVRLTTNWALGWPGLFHEDWRYVQLREERGRMPWWVINLGGIQLMPTLVVFAGMVSVWPAVTVGGRGFGLLDVVATVVTATAVVLETPPTDVQLRPVRRRSGAPWRGGRRGPVAALVRPTPTTWARSASGGGCGCSPWLPRPAGGPR